MDAHLNRVQYWEITIPEEGCVFFPSSTCTLYVSFCGRVPLDLCNNNELGPTSACVTDGTTGHSLGEYNDDPFLQSELQFESLCKYIFTFMVIIEMHRPSDCLRLLLESKILRA